MPNPVTDDITQWQDNASSTDTNLPVKDTSIGITTVGDLTGELRRIKSEIRGESIIKSWERWKGLMNLAGTGPITFGTATPTNFYVNDNFIGAARPIAVPGRRVRALLAGVTIYGRIKAVGLNPPNTSVEVLWDSGALDATLSEVQFGIDEQSLFNRVLDAATQGAFGPLSNTNQETPFYLPTIFGGTLGTKGRIDAELLIRLWLLPACSVDVRVSYGASQQLILTLDNYSNAPIVNSLCPLFLGVWANGAGNQQVLHGRWGLGALRSSEFGSSATIVNVANAIGTTTDSGVDQVLQTNILFSSADPNNQCDCLGATMTLR